MVSVIINDMEQTNTVIETTIACPFCSKQIDPKAFFCPECGKKVREKPVNTGLWGWLTLMGLSVLAPPFGLGMTVRYMKSPDHKAKTMGWTSLVVTILALILFSWWGIVFAQNINKQIGDSMKSYPGLGY